jgi:hypothetical protein
MKISEYLYLQDAIKSQTATRLGIDNKPTPEHLENIIKTAKVFDEVYKKYYFATVSSFYRSEKLNKAIKGSLTSQHCKGQAIDIDSPNNEFNRLIFEFIKDNLDFDQLIYEFGTDLNPDWVHVSISDNPRKQILRAKRVKGKIVYEPYK